MNPFKLEQYLARYEFNAPYLLCCSDAESIGMQDLVAMSDDGLNSRWAELRLQYTESAGMPELRQEIARVFYPGLEADNVLCFAGAEEGIYAALRVLCRPGEHIIVLTPCYQSLQEIPVLAGADVTAVPLRYEQEWRIDVDAIAAVIQSNTRGVVINFPHNPTGQIITSEELEALVTLCRKHDLWLFSDEVYRLLGAAQEWAPAAAVVYERAFSLGVMSKSFGMAGLRIGWLACQDKELLTCIKQYKDYLSICNSAPSELLALMALRSSEKILARNNHIIALNIGLVRDFMQKYQDLFSWIEPRGGCTGLVRYHGNVPIEELCVDVVEKSGVLLLPGSVYGIADPCFRIGFGRANMPQVLGLFDRYVREVLKTCEAGKKR